MIKTKGKHKKYTILLIIVIIGVIALWLSLPPEKKEKKPPSPKPEIKEILKPEIKEKPQYRIAVIIDDVGYPSQMIEEYKNFKGKLTFSVLPFLDESVKYAEILHERGFEILIHIPMEPLAYPDIDPGPQAIFSFDTKEQVEKKITMMIQDLPYAVGANNHMGSKATQDCDLMNWTMDVLKKKNLFFIDSVTANSSCAYENASAKKIPTAKRDVFLDNKDDYDSIYNQFEELKRIARRNGAAIGIGHFHRVNTIKVLKEQSPLLEEERFTLIFASEAVM